MAHTPASLLAGSAEEAVKTLEISWMSPLTAFQRIDLLVRVLDGLFQCYSLGQVDVDDRVVDHTLKLIHVDVPDASLVLRQVAKRSIVERLFRRQLLLLQQDEAHVQGVVELRVLRHQLRIPGSGGWRNGQLDSLTV